LNKLLLLLLFCFLSITEYAQESTDSISTDTVSVIDAAPKWHAAITNIPGDFAMAGKTIASKQIFKPLAYIAGSTALLYLFDKPLIDGARKLGDNMGLDPKSKFESFIKIGNLNIMQRPGNLNTGFYFIGEGWTSVLLIGGIGIHGAFTGNKKEVRMISQFAEGYIGMGIAVQLLKRSFGRESPKSATSPRGTFRLFPSFSKYQKHTNHYDAIPSGHMATMAFTVTLLAENFPDNRWIQPVGYSLIGICSFSMLNNKVHWASDYPLGFGVGYLFAKIVANRERRVIPAHSNNVWNHFNLLPTILYDGSAGLSLAYKW
jgi:hypothetical protein